MKIGIVKAIDPATCRCRVEFPDQDAMVSYWLPVLQKKTGQDKSYWLPDPGEQVCCLMDEHAEFGVIAGAMFNDADTPPVSSTDKFHVAFADGSSIEYDRASHTLTANIQGTVIVTATGGVTVHGNLTVNGNIAATGSVIDGGGNTNHHTH